MVRLGGWVWVVMGDGVAWGVVGEGGVSLLHANEHTLSRTHTHTHTHASTHTLSLVNTLTLTLFLTFTLPPPPLTILSLTEQHRRSFSCSTDFDVQSLSG